MQQQNQLLHIKNMKRTEKEKMLSKNNLLEITLTSKLMG